MKRPLRLRARLLLTYTLLIILGFGGLAWLAGGQIAVAAQEDFAAALQAQTELLAHSLEEDVEQFLEGEESGQELASRLANFASQLKGSLILLDARGRVVIDSRGQTSNGERRQTPEINAALSGRSAHAIRAAADGGMNLYTAAPLLHDGKVFAVIQLARPMSETVAAVRQRLWTLAGGVLLLGLLATGASLLLAASLTRPLEVLRTVALRLAAGDLNQRVPVTRQDEIGEVATAFNTMAEQVQTMVEEQRAFAANASHELRTPLTTIRLRSEALRGGQLEPALTQQYIAEIDDEATRLSGLVEDLILLARLDAGRAVRGTEEIDVARIARGLIRELEQLPEAQGVAIQLVAPPDLPALTASIHHLRVLLRNLLSNALAYTPAGGTVTCTLQADESCLHIVVTDTGRGIAPQDLPHVTERFYRADKAHTRSGSGSGLGLALVQSIIDCYGGRLEIHSPGLGQGTSAQVCWPRPPKNLVQENTGL
jgi:signal transduction histidine kinase